MATNNPLTFPPYPSKGGPGVTRSGNTQPQPRTVHASAHPGVWPGDTRRPPDRAKAYPPLNTYEDLEAYAAGGGR